VSESSRQQLEQWDRTAVWHAFTQMAEYVPLIIERAEGNVLYDLDGRALIDGVSSLWCNVHGHRHPRIDAAMREQLDRIAHCTSLGMSNPSTIRLAQRLVEITPAGLDHVFFAGDGAAAIEVALKIAFQYWNQCPKPQPRKTKFVALGEAYHGDTIGAVSVGDIGQFHAMFQPLLFDVLRLPSPQMYRLPAGTTRETAAAHYLAEMETLLAARHEEIAAVILEPLVQGAAGMTMQPPGYLRGVRELTQRYGVLLIADEVATGFGRTGTMFACEQEHVAPDLLCLGKGLTGGYLAMSATLATTEIFNAFLCRYDESKTLYHGHTYGGNPLAAAAALATLEVFEEENTLARIPEKVARLEEHLARIAQLPHVGDVRHRGLMCGIELVQDRAAKTPYDWKERRGMQACRVALERGVFLRPLGNVVVIMPPLSITLDELDQILLAAEAGIVAATQ